MNFFEFAKRVKILQCKYKINPEKLIKMLINIKRESLKLEENESKANHANNQQIILENKDVYLAGNYHNILPLLKSIYSQIDMNYSQEEIESTLKSINQKTYLKSDKPISKIKKIPGKQYDDEINYHINQRSEVFSTIFKDKSFNSKSQEIKNKKRAASSSVDKAKTIINMKLNLELYNTDDPELKIFDNIDYLLTNEKDLKIKSIESQDNYESSDYTIKNNRPTTAKILNKGRVESAKLSRPKTGQIANRKNIEIEINHDEKIEEVDEESFENINYKFVSQYEISMLPAVSELKKKSYHYKNLDNNLRRVNNTKKNRTIPDYLLLVEDVNEKIKEVIVNGNQDFQENNFSLRPISAIINIQHRPITCMPKINSKIKPSKNNKIKNKAGVIPCKLNYYIYIYL